VISPKLVEVGRHLNIELITNAELVSLEGEEGSFRAKIRQYPRFIDLSKCTSCGECAKACPIEVEDEYNMGLSKRKAAYKLYPQAIPGAYAISKRGTAPCKATCPAHVSIQGYIALIREGKYKEALELFKEAHPFPGICGRVCHHPCEGVCTRKDVDESLAIRYLHRFLADEDRKREGRYVPKVEEEREEKVAVIGSGPAGLSCAYFLRRKGYKVTVFEKLPVLGGMMAVGIPEYRLPRDVLREEIEVIGEMGVEMKTGVVFGEDITLKSLKEEGYKAVFLGLGLHVSRRLNVPKEELPQVIKGVDFLREVSLGKEVSIGKDVVVIGGGNVAIDVALTALRKGASKVRLVCLEQREEMPAWKYEIEEALEEGVEIINGWGPKEFLEEGGRLTAIRFKRCVRVFDENGRFNPAYDETELMDMSCESALVAIGQASDISCVEKEGIEIARGGIKADPVTLQTNVEWVFAGGDVYYGPKSVVEAVECGKEAAESIHRYLRGMDLREGREKEWSYEKPDTSKEEHKERIPMPKLALSERRGNFKEIALGFTEEMAKKEAERCLKCGICSECYQCVKACLAKAVDHEQKTLERELNVGSVILCPGSKPFDPSIMKDFYHYGSHPNVITSLEFERILSASGPTMGHMVRPSDHQEPKKIAWLQCVGSRDPSHSKNGYCSAVCCMYAIKEAVIAKDHAKGDLEAVIFFMDMRTYGKDYEKYMERAKDQGVRFVRSRIHTIYPIEETGNLLIRYSGEDGELKEEEFHLVVLSVGLEVRGDTKQLAKSLGIELDHYGFAKTKDFLPIATSRPGVYACGVFQAPKDIPSSVAEGSAAACLAGMKLSEARWKETKSVEIPEEWDVSQEEPRIGVFVCNCGINIAGVVNDPEVREYAKTLPYVVFATDNLFTCSQDSQERMKEVIKEHRLNRVVVASCSPRTHEPLFQETMQAVGLNKYLFEMANIRDQDSWVHAKDPEKATEKAKDLIRMAVARAGLLKPMGERRIPVVKRGLVIGGGVSGMNAALGLANQGFEVILLEREKELGGFSKRLVHTIDGDDVRAYVSSLVEQVGSHPKVKVILGAQITEFSGFKGNFKTKVKTDAGEEVVEHGIVILATGANEYRPKEFLYGEDPRVLTQVELSERLSAGGLKNLKQVVMIQCVGSRNQENPNCSRICCQSAIKNAIHLKEMDRDTEVFILYRDIRMYGKLEDYYRRARELGVLFFRFKAEEPPRVQKEGDRLSVVFKDHVLQRELMVYADCVALSAGMRATETDKLASILKVARTPEGHFLEAHVKLRPVEMAQEGVFLCGTAHSPMLIKEAISQAYAAASRATTFLSQSEIRLSAVTAHVDGSKCAACLICVRSCPFGVPRINEKGESEIDEALCQGCGICASECPAKAIELGWYEDQQIMSKVDALLEGVL